MLFMLVAVCDCDSRSLSANLSVNPLISAPPLARHPAAASLHLHVPCLWTIRVSIHGSTARAQLELTWWWARNDDAAWNGLASLRKSLLKRFEDGINAAMQ